MKAATGELNLTVITVIAIAAIIGFFWFLWPAIQTTINKQWANISGNYDGGEAESEVVPMNPPAGNGGGGVNVGPPNAEITDPTNPVAR